MPDPEVSLDAQITPAHVLGYIQDEVVPRLKAVEDTSSQSFKILKAAGLLNGKGDDLIRIVQEYRDNESSAAAWRRVRSDIGGRLRFLAPSWQWLALVAAGGLGAIGWQVVQTIHIPSFL